MLQTCYATKCRAEIGDDDVFCPQHVAMLPPDLHATIAEQAAKRPLLKRVLDREFARLVALGIDHIRQAERPHGLAGPPLAIVGGTPVGSPPQTRPPAPPAAPAPPAPPAPPAAPPPGVPVSQISPEVESEPPAGPTSSRGSARGSKGR